jgi:hypothetical protein
MEFIDANKKFNNLKSLNPKDVTITKKENGGWLDKYQEGGELENSFDNVKGSQFKPIDQGDVNRIKNEMASYINSPLYAQRQAMHPEEYMGNSEYDFKHPKFFQESAADAKRSYRLIDLMNQPSEIKNIGRLKDYYDPTKKKTVLNKSNLESVVAHELGHSLFTKHDMAEMYSDYDNSKQWDALSSGIEKPFVTSLNKAEVEKFKDFAYPIKNWDEHYDKDMWGRFANESYADLTGIRHLLYKNGITKSFGEKINRGILDEALKVKQIKNDPTFKRMQQKYSPGKIILLNNTIAQNDSSQQEITQAEHGAELNYNDYSVSAPEGYVGVGTFNEGRNYSPAWGGQFKEGGELPNVTVKGKRQPIVVTNPNDPRLKAYKDSLSLYNEGEKNYKKRLEFNKKNNIPKSSTRKWNDPVEYHVVNKKGDIQLNKIQPIEGNGYWYNFDPDNVAGTNVPSSLTDNYGFRYKKPTQPIEYINRIKQTETPELQDLSMGLPVDISLPELRRPAGPNRITMGKPLFPGGPQTDYYTPIDEAGNVVQSNDFRTSQFAMGGSLPGATGHFYARYEKGGPVKKFLQPTQTFMNLGYNPKENGLSTEWSTSIGGPGEVYLVPKFKQGRIVNPEEMFNLTGEHLGGPFKTVKAAEDFAQFRHNYVEKNKNIPAPFKTRDYKYGGLVPGDVGFSYPRTGEIPDNGKYAKKTMASAQNGTEIGPDGIPIDSKRKKGNTSVKSMYAQKKQDLHKLENDLNDKLDIEKAIDVAQDYITKNDRGNDWGMYNGPLDAVRHTASSAQTSSQLANLLPTQRYNPAVMLGSVLATNALGLGHELSSPNPLEEMASDIYNNLAGSVIGVLPGDETKRNERIKGALNNNILSNLKGKNSGDKPFDPRVKTTIDDSKNKPKNFIKGMGPLSNESLDAQNLMFSTFKLENGGEMKYYQEGLDFKPRSIGKNGKVIKDDRGQWAHPGEITEIGSNQITMQGVPYPVLGISNTGDTQMMYPNEEYEYDGESVIEYPMMKQGGQLTKLDQLLNFTNYNTKQPGGWLDKYQ